MDLTNYKDVTALLERHGFRFSKSLGQNFLTAAWVPRRIAEEALIAPGDGVLEVGPGVGCLTVELAEKAERVLALELDERLRGVLADLRSLCGDYFGDRPVRVCANLPYNVTSPLLTAFLTAGCFESVTVMVQKEVAARLCARPGTAEYGAFTLLVQWYSESEKLFDVPPDCFMPRPKVTSTVIRLCRRVSPPVRVRDEEFFFAVVRAAFNPSAFTGGMVGTIFIAMQKGIARGIFSNEAGLGSAPIAAAAAKTNEPVRQGLVCMTGTFIDTIVICTMTGLAIVVTGAWDPALKLEGVDITIEAFRQGLGFLPNADLVGPLFLSVALAFFAFTTILGWDYYSEKCLEYLVGRENKLALKVYRVLYVLVVFVGPYLTVSVVWGIADTFNGLMAFPNLVALVLLSPTVARLTRDYFRRLKAGEIKE